MKKFSFLCFLLINMGVHAIAQFRADIEGGLNQTNIISAPVGFNINVGVKYFVQNKFGLGLTTGEYRFRLKESLLKEQLVLIPALLSTEYILGRRKIRPYFGLDAGLIFVNKKHKYYYELTDFTSEGVYKNTFLVIVPTFGIRYFLNQKISISTSVRAAFNLLRGTSFVNLNGSIGMAYNF